MIKDYIRNPYRIFMLLGDRGLLNWLPDEPFLKLIYRANLGTRLDVAQPRGFNEKMQWLKLFFRREQFTEMADKYLVRNYLAQSAPEIPFVPIIGVWDRPESIDFDSLPERFVLKCTHDSGSVLLCTDKAGFDMQAARRMLKKKLRKNYFNAGREWPYKNIRPRIIAEEYLEDPGSPTLKVYKVLNFDGKPRVIQLINNDKTAAETINYYDTDWRLLPLRQNFPNSPQADARPEGLADMLRYAEMLAHGFPFLRTDFYEVEAKVIFSEFTFFSDSGLAPFYPPEWDRIWGDWITLPEKTV